MTPEEQALARVIATLDAIGIPYMVTGSLASSHHGRPRATHDIDMVIEPDAGTLARLVDELGRLDFYVDEQVARDALRRRRQFNAIDTNTAVKIDLIVRKDRPFSKEELARRVPVDLTAGLRAFVASPEDTILAKLEWARKGGESQRQLADVAGMVEVLGGGLDRAYVERWAQELGVADLWDRFKGRP